MRAAASERGALDEVLRCRAELESAPPATDPDTVPVVLALEVAYDVALLELARLVGVESDPDRFEQPQLERARLEGALREPRDQPRAGRGRREPVLGHP